MNEVTGDCFESNGRRLIELTSDLDPETVLVHGRVTQPTTGMRHTHAWLELGDVVFDHSNRKVLVTRRDSYYRSGEIEPAETWRYTQDEARTMAVSFKHWGPWEGPDAAPPMDLDDDDEDEDARDAAFIRGLYDMFETDDPDISTERLLQMTADAATEQLGREIDVADVADAMFTEAVEQGGS